MQYEAILFDCDGVLVDSEPLALRLLQEMLADLGWHLSAEECETLFIGKSTKDELQRIQARTGKKLEQDWIDEFHLRLMQSLRQKLVPVPGIIPTLQSVQAHWGARMACASASEYHKLHLQLEMTGLLGFFDDRIFSGGDVPRNKPYPDVYLKAMSSLGCTPEHCLIIEDSVTGIQAGVASGATVWAYDPKRNPAPLLELGVQRTFNHMQELPALLGLTYPCDVASSQ